MSLFALSLTFFLLMDSFGNIPIYLSILKPYPKHRRQVIVIRETLIALVIILVFQFTGAKALEALKKQKIKVLHKKLDKINRETTKDLLEKKLSKKDLESLKTSFDIVGDIIVIEIPDELGKKDQVIAKVLLARHSNVKTILKKAQ